MLAESLILRGWKFSILRLADCDDDEKFQQNNAAPTYETFLATFFQEGGLVAGDSSASGRWQTFSLRLLKNNSFLQT